MSTDLVDPMASVRSYLEAGQSSNTKRAYNTDWADFVAWCERVSCPFLPAEPIDVARYLAQLADGGLKASTIERRVAGIRSKHKEAGLEPPTNAEGVKRVMAGIRRTKGTRPNQKKPATAELLGTALKLLPETTRGIRDRALLLVGFAAGRRRSEIVALDVVDIEFRPKGMLVQIRRSKTDQLGKGSIIAIPRGRDLKPVAALEAWLQAAAITEGPIFREIDRHGNIGAERLGDRSVARIVKKTFAALGLDIDDFSGHSLRAGFVTTSLDRKVDPFKIMDVTGHKDVNTLRMYDRREGGFDDSAGEDFL
jgi:site-specific recombinase XerD